MPGMPKAAKVGLVIGAIGAFVGIGVAMVVVAINVLGVTSASTAEASTQASEGSSAAAGGGACAKAAACCETIGGPPAACANFRRAGMPDSACSSALDGYKQAASAQGKTCD
jgi:hypothetical protein